MHLIAFLRKGALAPEAGRRASGALDAENLELVGLLVLNICFGRIFGSRGIFGVFGVRMCVSCAMVVGCAQHDLRAPTAIARAARRCSETPAI